MAGSPPATASLFALPPTTLNFASMMDERGGRWWLMWWEWWGKVKYVPNGIFDGALGGIDRNGYTLLPPKRSTDHRSYGLVLREGGLFRHAMSFIILVVSGDFNAIATGGAAGQGTTIFPRFVAGSS